MEDSALEFGIDLPLRINHPYIPDKFTVGASLAFGNAATDVFVESDAGEITTDSIIAGIHANWVHEGVYIDGRLQYATFDNVLKILENNKKIADTNANAFSISAETGYAMKLADLALAGAGMGEWAADLGGLPDITLIPSAQLQWNRISFNNFMASGTAASLTDGNVIMGRVGIAAEGRAEEILWHGNANIIVPLDGKVGVNVAGTPISSERKDPALDLGIGATYEWDDAYAISADISTQQGSEVEGYAANIGFKYSF